MSEQQNTNTNESDSIPQDAGESAKAPQSKPADNFKPFPIINEKVKHVLYADPSHDQDPQVEGEGEVVWSEEIEEDIEFNLGKPEGHYEYKAKTQIEGEHDDDDKWNANHSGPNQKKPKGQPKAQTPENEDALDGNDEAIQDDDSDDDNDEDDEDDSDDEQGGGYAEQLYEDDPEGFLGDPDQGEGFGDSEDDEDEETIEEQDDGDGEENEEQPPSKRQMLEQKLLAEIAAARQRLGYEDEDEEEEERKQNQGNNIDQNDDHEYWQKQDGYDVELKGGSDNDDDDDDDDDDEEEEEDETDEDDEEEDEDDDDDDDDEEDEEDEDDENDDDDNDGNKDEDDVDEETEEDAETQTETVPDNQPKKATIKDNKKIMKIRAMPDADFLVKYWDDLNRSDIVGGEIVAQAVALAALTAASTYGIGSIALLKKLPFGAEAAVKFSLNKTPGALPMVKAIRTQATSRLAAKSKS